MSHSGGEFGFMLLALTLLAAAVISVPIARGLRLSAVVAYLVVGIVIGPFGLGLFRSPDTILAVAELGVVLLLFLIGLELELTRLLDMRRDIFGLGAAQLALTAAVLGGIAVVAGLADWRGAIVAGLALAMSATSIALRILEERGDLQEAYGQRAFAILLFQDMSVVPLLALLPLLAPVSNGPASFAAALGSAAKIAAAVAAVVIAGRYLLNPLLRLLAWTGAREVMTAAALFVVLGAAALMETVGMSMALGAFLAGVMLAGSNYRHELEADIEPFRGLLLAVFFMGVGMSIDMKVVQQHVWLILVAAMGITLLKTAIVGLLFHPTCPRSEDGVRAGSVLTAAGEFAYVLIPLGASLGALTATQASLFSAIAAVTMLIGPPFASASDWAICRLSGGREQEPDSFDGARGSVLLVGFGRFGQIVAQFLVAEGVDVTAIDNDPEMIQNAGRFGFKVYYGDGTRLDVLRAAGAANARVVAVCVDGQDTTNRIVDMVRAEFPGVSLYVRSYDRRHTLRLIAKGVDFELRETFESAMLFGRRTLGALGLSEERAGDVEADVRNRDQARLALQQAEGIYAGRDLTYARRVQPEPLSRPRREARPLNPEAGPLIEKERETEPSA
ncbi:MAG TPA: monovalent cation:proton antiporter-2 (CPA2) family protein [Xanthobacteraceae bacterium]|jgi:glutathione-regulated potassium-efflux system protein KefB|nr:monovalent cation:proton antiporter-2 (CPA2) family protein [Xanthobacteraceae bacterium]